MSKQFFEKGDRVRLVQTFPMEDPEGLKVGMLGTVLDNSEVPYVRWDGLTDGHTGHGVLAIEPGKARDVWAASDDQLELID